GVTPVRGSGPSTSGLPRRAGNPERLTRVMARRPARPVLHLLLARRLPRDLQRPGARAGRTRPRRLARRRAGGVGGLLVRRGSANYRARFFNGSAQGASPQRVTSIAPTTCLAGATGFEGTGEDTRRLVGTLRR